jgi:hypothetical protein
VIASFEDFHAKRPNVAADLLCWFDSVICRDQTEGEWRLLERECADRVDRELFVDPVLDYEPERKRPTWRPASSRSTTPGRVRFDAGNDPLKNGDVLMQYLEATGTVVSAAGQFRCPVPQHEDVHPSAKLWPDGRWKCWSCAESGDVVDVAGFVTGRHPSGPNYWWLRDHVLDVLLRSPLPSERRQR